MEERSLSHPATGTPEGGVVSPILSNIYLHKVLDEWFEATVKPRLIGRAVLIRFADDFVLVFQLETDARRVLDVLPKRFAKYGLRLHPDKTRLMRFEHAFSGRKRPAIPTRRRPPIPTEGDHPFRPEGGHFFRFVGIGGRDRLEQVVAFDRNQIRWYRRRLAAAP